MDIGKYKTLIAELSKGYQPGSSHWVTITHINNPHSFYVQATQFMSLLQAVEAQVPESKAAIHESEISLLNSILNKTSYTRGRVLSTYEKDGDTVCDILKIDYGDIKKGISLKSIWRCSDTIRYLPPLAFHCQLSRCAPIGNQGWAKEAIEAMVQFCGQERTKMIIDGKTGDKQLVTLINSCPDDINTMLALTGFSTFGYSHNMVSRIPTLHTKKMFFTFKNITINKLHVRMQYGNSLNEFYVAEVNDYKNFEQNRDFMFDLAKKQKALMNEELVVNMPICVLEDTRSCHRAIVKSLNPKSNVSVQMMDIGKKLLSNTLCMKQMPDVWLAEPVLAIYCCAEKNQLQDYRLNSIFQLGYEFHITIKQLGHEFDTPNVVHIKMINENDDET